LRASESPRSVRIARIRVTGRLVDIAFDIGEKSRRCDANGLMVHDRGTLPF